jgi:AraC-like DNA-binding protein
MDKAERLSITLSVRQLNTGDLDFFFTNPVQGNNSRILGIRKYLQDTVSTNHEYIESIEIYYMHAGMVISSQTGVSFLQPGSARHQQYLYQSGQFGALGINPIWLSDVRDTDRIPASGRSRYALLRAYPNNVRETATTGFFVFTIRPEAFADIVRNPSSEHGAVMLIDGPEIIMSSGDAMIVQQHFMSQDMNLLFQATPEPSNTVMVVDGMEFMVSHITLYNGWQLVYTMPIHEYYSKTTIVRRTVIAICVVTIIIGLIISRLIASKIYKPLRQLVKKIFDSDKRYSLSQQNEYKIIDQAFADLSETVDQMQQTLVLNQPLIQHNLVESLVHGSMHTREEVVGLLRLSGCQMPHAAYRVLLVSLSSQALMFESFDRRAYIRYALLGNIKQASCEDYEFISTFLSDSVITIVANVMDTTASVRGFAAGLLRDLAEDLKVPATISIGPPVLNTADIASSYANAAQCLRHAFFCPDDRIIDCESISRSIKISWPDDLREQFAAALKARDMKAVIKAVERYNEHARSDRHAFDDCWTGLVDLVKEMTSFIRNSEQLRDCLDISWSYPRKNDNAGQAFGASAGQVVSKQSLAMNFSDDSIYDLVTSFADLDDFTKWITETARQAIKGLLDFDASRTARLIGQAQTYVREHISDCFSLADVALQTGWSTHHFSKMFKQVTGQNFVDYLTEERMRMAREYLMERKDLTVEEIATQVGYNSSAYFISKFKSRYQMTPNAYRLIQKND